jgi:hypothetical protein
LKRKVLAEKVKFKIDWQKLHDDLYNDNADFIIEIYYYRAVLATHALNSIDDRYSNHSVNPFSNRLILTLNCCDRVEDRIPGGVEGLKVAIVGLIFKSNFFCKRVVSVFDDLG